MSRKVDENGWITYTTQNEPIEYALVKHGRWIEENRRPKSSLFYCSECHRTAYDIQPSRAKGWVKRCRYAFCPNCGAIMDEVSE